VKKYFISIKNFNSIKEASIELGVRYETIRRVVTGERKQTKGYSFEYR